MPDDDLSETELGVAAAIRNWDDVPANEVARALEVFELRRVDGELARLVEESGHLLSGARFGNEIASTSFTFEAAGTTVEVDVDADVGGVRLVGQIIPPEGARVVVEGAGGEHTTEIEPLFADDLGRFVVVVRPGLVRLRLTERPAAGTADLVTEFFRC